MNIPIKAFIEVQRHQLRNFHRYPTRVVLTVAASVFVAETLVMIILHHWPQPYLVEMLLDGFLLLLLLVPTFYLLLFRPLLGLIAAHERAEASLQASADRTRAILGNVFDGVITIDQRGIITSFNQSAQKMFGYQAGEVLGRNISFLMPEPFRSEHDGYLRRYLQEGTPHIIGIGREVTGLRKDGSLFPADLAITELLAEQERIFIGVVRDITLRMAAENALKRANEELEQRVVERTAELRATNDSLHAEIEERRRVQEMLDRMARTDGLTGILNRREFDVLLREEMARATRYRTGLSVILFDVDHFKRINDTQGHITGDAVLVGLATLVSSALRTHDVFARWGGEEFVVLVPQTSLENACRLANKLRAHVADYAFDVAGRVTCSFGVAELLPGDTPESLVGRADRALYRAKNGGRNRVVCGCRHEGLDADPPCDSDDAQAPEPVASISGAA